MKTRNIYAVVVLTIFAIVFWGLYWISSTHLETTKGLGVLDVRNGTYLIDGTSVTLRNGYSSVDSVPGSASKTETRYFGNEARGDVNGDGRLDEVFLLTQTMGGSGTFFYVVAALQGEGGYNGTNAVLLGDRIAPQSTEIRNGEIVVNYVDRAVGEPMTAKPSLGVSKYLTVEDGVLIEKSQ